MDDIESMYPGLGEKIGSSYKIVAAQNIVVRGIMSESQIGDLISDEKTAKAFIEEMKNKGYIAQFGSLYRPTEKLREAVRESGMPERAMEAPNINFVDEVVEAEIVKVKETPSVTVRLPTPEKKKVVRRHFTDKTKRIREVSVMEIFQTHRDHTGQENPGAVKKDYGKDERVMDDLGPLYKRLYKSVSLIAAAAADYRDHRTKSVEDVMGMGVEDLREYASGAKRGYVFWLAKSGRGATKVLMGDLAAIHKSRGHMMKSPRVYNPFFKRTESERGMAARLEFESDTIKALYITAEGIVDGIGPPSGKPAVFATNDDLEHALIADAVYGIKVLGDPSAADKRYEPDTRSISRRKSDNTVYGLEALKRILKEKGDLFMKITIEDMVKVGVKSEDVRLYMTSLRSRGVLERAKDGMGVTVPRSYVVSQQLTKYGLKRLMDMKYRQVMSTCRVSAGN